jgi:hypothetical protein
MMSIIELDDVYAGEYELEISMSDLLFLGEKK